LPSASVFVALELYLAWYYRAAFRPLFAAKSTRETNTIAPALAPRSSSQNSVEFS
jgi:hypothetical protein